jgi:hypothetical protein
MGIPHFVEILAASPFDIFQQTVIGIVTGAQGVLRGSGKTRADQGL